MGKEKPRNPAQVRGDILRSLAASVPTEIPTPPASVLLFKILQYARRGYTLEFECIATGALLLTLRAYPKNGASDADSSIFVERELDSSEAGLEAILCETIDKLADELHRRL